MPRHDLPYGVEFTNTSGEPCSLFLVGKNGTGKSTIFDALEWIYAGKVSNAEDRGVKNQEKLYEYLTYGFNLVPGISPEKVISVRLMQLPKALSAIRLIPSGIVILVSAAQA